MDSSRKSVTEAFDASVASAVAAERIDRHAQAALIAAGRKVAALMDEPGWPIICADEQGKGGKYDNVSPSTLLKYCEALGICPDLDAADKRKVNDGLAKLRGEFSVMGGKRARAS